MQPSDRRVHSSPGCPGKQNKKILNYYGFSMLFCSVQKNFLLRNNMMIIYYLFFFINFLPVGNFEICNCPGIIDSPTLSNESKWLMDLRKSAHGHSANIHLHRIDNGFIEYAGMRWATFHSLEFLWCTFVHCTRSSLLHPFDNNK